MASTSWTREKARSAAVYLLKFRGLGSIEVVEDVRTGVAHVRYENSCGVTRRLWSAQDLVEAKESELVDLPMVR
jgi:hypothetical protein